MSEVKLEPNEDMSLRMECLGMALGYVKRPLEIVGTTETEQEDELNPIKIADAFYNYILNGKVDE